MARTHLTVCIITTLASLARCAVRVACETTVKANGGVLEIELFPTSAPIGVQRVVDLVEGGFFTDLPFYDVREGDMVLFGISPSAAMQKTFDAKGNIMDDDPPCSTVTMGEGILSFSGDPGIGRDSRSTILFLTLGRHLAWHRRRPWEVPVGRVKKGIAVLRGIYAGYGDEPQLGQLDPTKDEASAAKYLAGFPKMDRFKSCSIVRDNSPDVIPGWACATKKKKDEL